MPQTDPKNAHTTFDESATPTVSKAYLRYVIFLLAIVNMFNYIDRTILSVVLQPIKDDLGLSDTQLGLLTGLAFALFYAVCGIPIARWADRGVRRNIISLAIAVWSVMTALTGIAQNFYHLLLARIGIGAGEAGCLPPSHSIISDYFPVEKRSSALAIHATGATLGGMIGLALGGWIATLYGWRAAFLLLGLPGLLLALIVRFTLKEPPRGYSDDISTTDPPAPLSMTLRKLFQKKSYFHLIMASALAVFSLVGINQWLPSFYTRNYGLTTAQTGFFFGFVYGAGGAVGAILGGFLADLLTRRNIRYVAWFACIIYLLAFPFCFGLFFMPNAFLALTLNFVYVMITGASNGPIFAMIQGVAGVHTRAVAIAISMFVCSVVGMGAGPFFVGYLSDLLAGSLGDHSLKYALVVSSCLTLFPAVHFFLASKHLGQDFAGSKQA